jgi:hypothetical protein
VTFSRSLEPKLSEQVLDIIVWSAISLSTLIDCSSDTLQRLVLLFSELFLSYK